MSEPAPAKRPWRRRLRTAGLLAVGFGTASLLGLTAAVFWLRTDTGNEFLRRQLDAAVDGAMAEGDFQVGRLETDLFTTWRLSEVAVVDEDGREVVLVEETQVVIRPLTLLSGELTVEDLTLAGVHGDVHVEEDGRVDLQRLFGIEASEEESGPWEGLPIDVFVESVRLVRAGAEVDGTEGPLLSVAGVGLEGRASVVDKLVTIEDLALVGDLAVPELARVRASGGATWDGDVLDLSAIELSLGEGQLFLDGQVSALTSDVPQLDLSLKAEPFDLAPIDAFADAGLGGQYKGELALTGPLNEARIAGRLDGTQGSRGGLGIDLGIDLADPDIPWEGTLVAESFHVEDAVGSVGEEPLVVSGALTAKGRGTTWPGGIVVDGSFEGTEVLAYGAEVHESRAQLSLRDGVLAWTKVVTDGPMGPLNAGGSYDFETGKVRTKVTGRAYLAELDRFGATDLGGEAEVDLRVAVDTSMEGTPVRVTGRIVAEPFAYGADVYVERVEADVVVDVFNGVTSVDADLLASRGQAYGVDIAEYRDSTVHVDVDHRGTHATGGGRFAVLEVPEVANIDSGEVAWDVRLDPKGAMVVSAAIEHESYSLLKSEGPNGRIIVDLEDDVAHVEAWMGSDGNVPNLDTTLDFDLASSTLVAPALLVQPVPGSVFRADRTVRLRLADEGGGVRDADIALSGPDGYVLVTGDVGMAGPLAGRVEAKGVDLGVVSALAELDDPLTGRVGFDLALSGDASDANLELTSLTVMGFDGSLDITGEADGYGHRIYPRLDARIDGQPLVSVGGELPVHLDLSDPRLLPDETVDLQIALRAGRLERLEPWAGELPAGKASGAVTLSGVLGNADVDGAGVAEIEAEGWSRPVRLEWSVARDGEELTYWADVFEGFERRGELVGSATTRADEIFAWALRGGEEPPWEDYDLYATGLDGEVDLQQIPAGSVFALAGSPAEVGGALSGSVSVGGSATRPVAEAAVRWDGGHIGDAKLDLATFELAHTTGLYEPTVSLQFDKAGSFFLGGEVPLEVDLGEEDWRKWQTGELDLAMGGDGVPLTVFGAIDPGIANAKGRLVLEGTVEGRLDKPEPDLRTALVDAALDYLPLGLRMKTIDFELTANERLVSLKTLQVSPVPIRRSLKSGFLDVVEDGPPAIDARGSMRIEDWAPGKVQGRIKLDDALVSAREDQLLRLSGGVDITETWPELSVQGRVKVDQGYISLDAATFYETAPLQLDDKLVVVRSETPDFDLDGEEDEEEPPLYENFDVGIVFDMNRSVEGDIIMPFLDDLGALGASITSADVNVRLDGEGRIGMEGGDLALLGEVEVIDGKARVIQSTFDLTGGSISFIGEDYTNPALDLSGTMAVSGGAVDLRVRGTPSAPEIDFSSEDYPDQQQIFTILLTGRAPDELNEEQGAAAASAAGGLLLQSVLGGTSLGGFSVEPDGTVSVGVPVAPSVFVRSSFSPRPELDENSVTVVAEWAVARKLVLEAAWGDQNSWGNVFWELRF